jgi:hypothetical protein
MLECVEAVALARPRRLIANRLPEHYAIRPHIDPISQVLAFKLFRRHVSRAARDRGSRQGRPLDLACASKVCNLSDQLAAGAREENVAGVEVAVNNALGVDVAHAPTNVCAGVDCLGSWAQGMVWGADVSFESVYTCAQVASAREETGKLEGRGGRGGEDGSGVGALFTKQHAHFLLMVELVSQAVLVEATVEARLLAELKDHSNVGLVGRLRVDWEVCGSAPECDNVWVANADEDRKLEEELAHLELDLQRK